MIHPTLRHLEIYIKDGSISRTAVDFGNLDTLKVVQEDRVCNGRILEGIAISMVSLELSGICSSLNIFLYGSFVLPNLTKLVMTHLPYLEALPFYTFKGSSNLEHLDLSYNGLKGLETEVLMPLTKLNYLDLRYNKLTIMTFVNPLMLTLNYLDLSGNSLISIPEEIFKRASNLEYLDISNNAFDCTCPSVAGLTYFTKWLNNDNSVLLNVHDGDFLCFNPPNLTDSLITDVDLDCEQPSHSHKPNVHFILGLSIPTLMILAAGVFLVIKWRWRIRYKLFQLRHQTLRHPDYLDNDMDNFVVRDDEEEVLDEEDARRPLRFDAYVAYHDNDQDWVLDELVKNIEGEYLNEEGEMVQNEEQVVDTMVLHIPERDAQPGQPRIRAVTDAIQRSMKTILVLSQNFMGSEWCYFQMQIAFERLFAEGRDVIILILLEDVPYEQMTRELRKLLRRKRYLKWPDDPVGRRLFWGRLREKIKKPTLVDRRFEI